jgi:dolichol-phosphate mannosyltransferase
MTTPHVSLIICTYGERGSLEAMWPTLSPILQQINAELIIVDDNSPDGTAEFARTLQNPTPTVLVRKNAKGLASATALGFRHARGELIAVMDGDYQCPPEMLPRLVKAVDDGAEMAVGCRRHDGEAVKADGLLREVSSTLARAGTRLLTRVNDPMNEFYVIRRSVLERVSYKPFGARTDLNLLVRARPNPVVSIMFTRQKRTGGSSKANFHRVLTDILLIVQLHVFKLKRFITGATH